MLCLVFFTLWANIHLNDNWRVDIASRLKHSIDCGSWRTIECWGSLEVNTRLKCHLRSLPGIACPFFLQYSNNLIRLSPVTTPAGTIPFKPMIFGLKTDVITLWVQLYWLQVNSVSMTWKATVDDDNTLITWPSWQCSIGHMLIFYW